MLQIRVAEEADLPDMQALFTGTIRSVNQKDYTPEQIRVWTSTAEDMIRWRDKFILNQYCICALSGDQIVGFASLEHDYLDLLYVHKDFQRLGIAKMLLHAILQEAIKNKNAVIYTEASITALPFFEHQGFELIKKNKKELKGIELTNYSMKKEL